MCRNRTSEPHGAARLDQRKILQEVITDITDYYRYYKKKLHFIDRSIFDLKDDPNNKEVLTSLLLLYRFGSRVIRKTIPGRNA